MAARTQRRRRRTSASRGKKKRRPIGYKTLTGVTFLLLTIYLLGYLVAFVNKPSISVEKVDYGSISSPLSFTGVAVRDEIVTRSEMDGQCYYNYAENERVKKGVVIGSIKNVSTTEPLEEKISAIDRDIMQVQKSREDISAFQEDINSINEGLHKAMDTYAYQFSSGNMEAAYGLKNQLAIKVDRRNEIWITENTKSLTELTAERNKIDTQLSGNMVKLTASASGILSFSLDGYEEVFTPDSLSQITAEQTKMKVQPETIARSQPVNSGDPVYKVIKSNVWRIASYIPNSEIGKWEEGSAVVLSILTDQGMKELPTTVEMLRQEQSDTYCVFQTDQNIIDFLGYRSVSFQVKTDEKKGLKVPINSIVEKTLFLVPKDYVAESLGEKGVIKRENGTDTFIRVNVVSEDDEKNACYISVGKDAPLKIGNNLVSSEKGDAPAFEIKEVETKKGVYVANTAVAKFTAVTVIEENNEYAVVSVEESRLKPYDTIVSDAKSVEESEEIY